MNTIHIAWPMLLAITSPAPAQTMTPAPAGPKAAPTTLPYESAFAGYRAYQEPQLQPWQEANAQVAKPQPHGAHGTQAADPHARHDMSKMKAADPHAGHAMDKKKPDPHAGHKMPAPKPAVPASDPHKDHQH